MTHETPPPPAPRPSWVQRLKIPEFGFLFFPFLYCAVEMIRQLVAPTANLWFVSVQGYGLSNEGKIAFTELEILQPSVAERALAALPATTTVVVTLLLLRALWKITTLMAANGSTPERFTTGGVRTLGPLGPLVTTGWLAVLAASLVKSAALDQGKGQTFFSWVWPLITGPASPLLMFAMLGAVSSLLALVYRQGDTVQRELGVIV